MANLENVTSDVTGSDIVSCDSLFEGELCCFQHRDGYRFSIDAVLLAHFIEINSSDRILDLGTGSGIVSLIMLYRGSDKIQKVCGIEVQKSLAALAVKNFQANGYQKLGRVILGNVTDIKKLVAAESYDKVVCNPPFYKPDAGRKNQNPEAMVARHQVLATLKDFLCASAFSVKNGGRVFYIYPAEYLQEFIVHAREVRLELKKIQCIYSYPQPINSARLVLLECKKNGGQGLEIMPPLYIYSEKKGSFSPEVMRYYLKNNDITAW